MFCLLIYLFSISQPLEAKKKQANDYLTGKANEAIDNAKNNAKGYLKGMLKP